jgi:hypothetical protein
MPAVTVDDVSTLPELDAAPPGATPRPVIGVTTAPSGFEGEGFPVRRAFAGVARAQLDPFIHMDQMGPVDYRPGEAKGTSWHPHRGFETVTYIIDGTFEHQDSAGGGGVISDGDTQWMTAGKGLLHIEAPPAELVRRGGRFHGVQLWVNLPASLKSSPPRYQDIRADQVALARSADRRALVRVIAGEVAGRRGPGSTHTPIALVHATLQPGSEVVLPWPRAFNALVYGLSGRGALGAERRILAGGQLALFGTGAVRLGRPAPEETPLAASTSGAGDTLVLHGPAEGDDPFDVLILGGEPIREPVVAYGPFVMNTEEEIAQAFADFQAGRLGTIPRGAR